MSHVPSLPAAVGPSTPANAPLDADRVGAREARLGALTLVHDTVASPNPDLRIVLLRVERFTISKRLWRGTAEDGTEFGFDLATPLRNGDTFFQSAAARYVVQQEPEAVVEISLELAPSAAAGIGWAVGNLHLELSADAERLVAADEPAVRQLLDRLKIRYRATTAVFRPGHFARGGAQPTDELGRSHRH